jgi:hypothetical protein
MKHVSHSRRREDPEPQDVEDGRAEEKPGENLAEHRRQLLKEPAPLAATRITARNSRS